MASGSNDASDAMDVDASTFVQQPATLNANVFTSSAFTAASVTFQDHLFSGWKTAPTLAKLEKFNERVQEGSDHAEWKDEAWDAEALPQKQRTNFSFDDLAHLAKRSLVREGDLLAYKRTFSPPGITVEKDLLASRMTSGVACYALTRSSQVRSIDRKSHALDLLLQPGLTKSLPLDLMVIGAPDPTPPTLTMEGVLSSVDLEDGILEVVGQITKADIYTVVKSAAKDPEISASVYSTRSAKAVSVWRWPEEVTHDQAQQMIRPRGGRELLASVYFMRNT
ncbi:hypothetical protein EUX98_g1486 [Antrodiella citrinella]|uniref:Uncharacterized protein n=1 Tax=Antrodiella citrinella TaxID=2447956 RepID=A0A4S4N188_9APHY|nr:hypothetical protein EUX98_g1486 [Antrodiella citrinella]